MEYLYGIVDDNGIFFDHSDYSRTINGAITGMWDTQQ